MSAGRRGLPLLLAGLVVAVAAATAVALRDPSTAPLRHGTPAPDFELSRLDGSRLALAELRGRPVFVNFWATWCAPCREEAPSLERLYRKFEPGEFEILAVSIDDSGARAEVDAFAREFGLAFPVLFDPDRSAYAAYRASGVPETFLVDPQGRVVERFIGPRDWDQPRYERALRRLIDG